MSTLPSTKKGHSFRLPNGSAGDLPQDPTPTGASLLPPPVSDAPAPPPALHLAPLTRHKPGANTGQCRPPPPPGSENELVRARPEPPGPPPEGAPPPMAPSADSEAKGKHCLQECQGTAETVAAKGKRFQQDCQDPAEKAEADGKPALAEKHFEVAAAAPFSAGSGGMASPMPPLHCSLQDLPVEMLVNIFASLPGTDLASLAQACTKFRHILCTDSIWRQRCWEEYGVRENSQNPAMIVQLEPCFRILLMERKSASVESYMDNPYSFFHKRHLQIQKDRFSIQCVKRDHQKDSPWRLRGERGPVLLVEDFLLYNRLTYCRVYLPPSHAEDLIRPGRFQCVYYHDSLEIVMLSFHGKYASVINITGQAMNTKLEIHLMCRIHQPDGEIFRNFNELFRVVQEIDEQVIREQQQEQQEDGTEESQGHGWQSPAQPSVWESRAAASEEQPVSFVLPEGVGSRDQNYPRTCRMCFYGVEATNVTSPTFVCATCCPGVFILFDENHFRFIWLEAKYSILFGRVQNNFQNVEAPSQQVFLEMLLHMKSGPPGRNSLHAL
ncbi:F-box only protein 31-like [Myotis yumanensis]|uniref:F-box only protein 31-like n=1 Tax=Myotis yumanensis TaxID=159337 RepID=UPI0038D3DA56